jgi:sugar phosphate isomerase/epimerase
MPTVPPLLASYFTLAGDVNPWGGALASPYDLRERAEAASHAGFRGMGIIPDDVSASIGRYGVPGVKNILADNGIEYLELEGTLDWFADGELRRISDATRRELMDAAAKLGAWSIKAVGDIYGGDWPLDRMIECFRDLCVEASETGTQVAIEIFPTSNIRDLPTAIAIVEGAGVPNGGLLLDIWHFTRGNIPYQDIETIPAQRIKHIELDDATAEQIGDLMEDSIDRRRLPGEGDFDIPKFLRHIRNAGYSGPYGVEIVSKEHRALPLKEAAVRAFNATAAQFSRIS